MRVRAYVGHTTVAGESPAPSPIRQRPCRHCMTAEAVKDRRRFDDRRAAVHGRPAPVGIPRSQPRHYGEGRGRESFRVRVSRWLSGRKRERVPAQRVRDPPGRVPDRLLSKVNSKRANTIAIPSESQSPQWREDSAFVDAGAHAGTILKHLVRIAPRGEWLPPLSQSHRSAGDCEIKFPQVASCEEVALSDYEGTAAFHMLTDDPDEAAS